MTFRQGEIFSVDFSPQGAHPFVLLSREGLNKGSQAIAAMITSSNYEFRSKLPNCVPLRTGEFGMTKNCVIQCENIVSISTEEIRGEAIGMLDPITMREVIKALGNVLDADCEPT